MIKAPPNSLLTVLSLTTFLNLDLKSNRRIVFFFLAKVDRLSRLKALILIHALRIPRLSLHGFHKSVTIKTVFI
jgi:hypothetical protein